MTSASDGVAIEEEHKRCEWIHCMSSPVVRKFAVIVGCSEYTNFEGLCLPGAIEDMRLLRPILYMSDYRIVELSVDKGVNPTKETVLRHLQQVRCETSDTDLLLVYVSAHAERTDNQFRLLLADASVADSSLLYEHELKRVMCSVNNSVTCGEVGQRSVLITDACNTGAERRPKNPISPTPPSSVGEAEGPADSTQQGQSNSCCCHGTCEGKKPQQAGFVHIAASRGDQRAGETGRGGDFTRNLTREVYKKLTTEPNQKVTVQQTFDLVTQALSANNSAQQPTSVSIGVNPHDFVLFEKVHDITDQHVYWAKKLGLEVAKVLPCTTSSPSSVSSCSCSSSSPTTPTTAHSSTTPRSEPPPPSCTMTTTSCQTQTLTRQCLEELAPGLTEKINDLDGSSAFSKNSSCGYSSEDVTPVVSPRDEEELQLEVRLDTPLIPTTPRTTSTPITVISQVMELTAEQKHSIFEMLLAEKLQQGVDINKLVETSLLTQLKKNSTDTDSNDKLKLQVTDISKGSILVYCTVNWYTLTLLHQMFSSQASLSIRLQEKALVVLITHVNVIQHIDVDFTQSRNKNEDFLYFFTQLRAKQQQADYSSGYKIINMRCDCDASDNTNNTTTTNITATHHQNTSSECCYQEGANPTTTTPVIPFLLLPSNDNTGDQSGDEDYSMSTMEGTACYSIADTSATEMDELHYMYQRIHVMQPQDDDIIQRTDAQSNWFHQEGDDRGGGGGGGEEGALTPTSNRSISSFSSVSSHSTNVSTMQQAHHGSSVSAAASSVWDMECGNKGPHHTQHVIRFDVPQRLFGNWEYSSAYCNTSVKTTYSRHHCTKTCMESCGVLQKGTEYCVQVVSKLCRPVELQYFFQTLDILQRLHPHPSSLQLYDVFQTDQHFFMVTETLKNMTELYEYIDGIGSGMTERQAATVTRNILQALQYLHSKHVIYRDLKPENVFIDNITHTIKLVDFSCAISLHRHINQVQNGVCTFACWYRNACGYYMPFHLLSDIYSYINNPTIEGMNVAGTTRYLAPEMLSVAGKGKPYTMCSTLWDMQKADMYSLGVILHILLTHRFPYRSTTTTTTTGAAAGGGHVAQIKALLSQITAGLAFPVQYWHNRSEGSKQLLKMLLQVDPANRPTTNDVLTHTWLLTTPDVPLLHDHHHDDHDRPTTTTGYNNKTRQENVNGEKSGSALPPPGQSRTTVRTTETIADGTGCYTSTPLKASFRCISPPPPPLSSFDPKEGNPSHSDLLCPPHQLMPLTNTVTQPTVPLTHHAHHHDRHQSNKHSSQRRKDRDITTTSSIHIPGIRQDTPDRIFEKWSECLAQGFTATGRLYVSYPKVGMEGLHVGKEYRITTINKRTAAVKIHRFSDTINIIKQLDHPSCLPLRHVFQNDDDVFIVNDSIAGMTELFEHLGTLGTAGSNQVTEEQAQQVTRELLIAVSYLQAENLIHRNLKPENIFVDNNVRNIKITNFEFVLPLSHYVNQQQKQAVDSSTSLALCFKRAHSYFLAPHLLSYIFQLTCDGPFEMSVAGSMNYMPPEGLQGLSKPDRSISVTRYMMTKWDIYSIGVICCVMLTGRWPFEYKHTAPVKQVASLLGNIHDGVDFDNAEKWQGVSTLARQVVQQMLDFNYQTRPSAEQLLQHPWLAVEQSPAIHSSGSIGPSPPMGKEGECGVARLAPFQPLEGSNKPVGHEHTIGGYKPATKSRKTQMKSSAKRR